MGRNLTFLRTARSNGRGSLGGRDLHRSERGFTLIELMAVVVLIALLSTLMGQRFGTITGIKQRSTVRQFASTWELLFHEALSRGEAYRIILDIDDNSYSVRRVIQPEGTSVRNVDYLKNLRTKGEKERRKAKELQELPSLQASIKEEERRESDPLDIQFFRALYTDPSGDALLEIPLEFPSLAKPTPLGTGVVLRRVKTAAGVVEQGQAEINLSPRGASSFAVVTFESERQWFTVFMNPSSGELQVFDREVDFDWTFGEKKEEE